MFTPKLRAERRRFVAGASAVAAMAILKGNAKGAQFEFKCASNLPKEHPTSVRLTQMWAAIEKESAGRLHTQFFPNSMLGGDAAMFAQLRLGAVQFFFISAGNLASLVPAANITFLGFAFRDAAEALRVVDGPLGTFVRDETGAKGIYLFRTIWDAGMNHIASNTHPIRNPNDLRGFKIRIAETNILSELFRAFGASPAPISVAETYTAAQTKLIDGVSVGVASEQTLRWFEVTKYFSLTNHSWAGVWLIANGDAWKSLPPDLQEIVERNTVKYAKAARRDQQLLEPIIADKLTRQGLVLNPVDQAPFRALLRPYYESWANAFGPKEWDLLETSLGRKLS